MDIVHPDFSRVFHMVSYSLILETWMCHGLDEWSMWWW